MDKDYPRYLMEHHLQDNELLGETFPDVPQ